VILKSSASRGTFPSYRDSNTLDPQQETPRQASAMKSFRRLYILLTPTFEISEDSPRQRCLSCPLLFPLACEFTSIESRIFLSKSLNEIQVGPFLFGPGDLQGSPSQMLLLPCPREFCIGRRFPPRPPTSNPILPKCSEVKMRPNQAFQEGSSCVIIFVRAAKNECSLLQRINPFRPSLAIVRNRIRYRFLRASHETQDPVDDVSFPCSRPDSEQPALVFQLFHVHVVQRNAQDIHGTVTANDSQGSSHSIRTRFKYASWVIWIYAALSRAKRETGSICDARSAGRKQAASPTADRKNARDNQAQGPRVCCGNAAALASREAC
jgi:hypothetical protein